jgi:hypothetical protein
MKTLNQSVRNQLRIIHILASLLLGVFIYSPWRNNPGMLIAVGIVVFPLLSFTGLWMWQGGRIKKMFKEKTILSQELN